MGQAVWLGEVALALVLQVQLDKPGQPDQMEPPAQMGAQALRARELQAQLDLLVHQDQTDQMEAPDHREVQEILALGLQVPQDRQAQVAHKVTLEILVQDCKVQLDLQALHLLCQVQLVARVQPELDQLDLQALHLLCQARPAHKEPQEIPALVLQAQQALRVGLDHKGTLEIRVQVL